MIYMWRALATRVVVPRIRGRLCRGDLFPRDCADRVGLKTVLKGRIRIENRKLTVEVNSLARAKAVRATIEQLLGERARYRRSRKQSMESVVPPMTGGPGIRGAARSAEDEELMQHPEVRAQLAEM
jgi:hypothetical protein